MVDEVPRFISLWSGPLRGKSVNSNPKPPYKGCRQPLHPKNELNSREHPFQPADISGNSCDFKTESISSAVGKVETVTPLRVLSGRHEKLMVSSKWKKRKQKLRKKQKYEVDPFKLENFYDEWLAMARARNILLEEFAYATRLFAIELLFAILMHSQTREKFDLVN